MNFSKYMNAGNGILSLETKVINKSLLSLKIAEQNSINITKNIFKFVFNTLMYNIVCSMQFNNFIGVYILSLYN